MLRLAIPFFSKALVVALLLAQLLTATPLADENGSPSHALLELLALHNVEHDGTWPSIIEKTQPLLRPSYRELSDLEDDGLDKERVFSLSEELGLIHPRYPSKRHYTYGVIFGSYKEYMEQRVQFLFAQGVSFDELVFLIDENEEVPEVDWDGKVRVVIAHGEGNKQRATTHDTLVAWAPTEGTALLVSSQPFIERQDAIAHNALSIACETIGTGVTYEDFLAYPAAGAIIWETVIRWIYAVYCEHPSR